MRHYKIEEIKTIRKIICNKCGKEIPMKGEIAQEDVLDVEKRWGYFSKKCISLIYASSAMTN